MHPHLNHLGADLSRGLLQFAEGRPLGEHGMFWLYVQAANLWGQGVDKLPLWGRYKWVEDHLGQVVGECVPPGVPPVVLPDVLPGVLPGLELLGNVCFAILLAASCSNAATCMPAGRGPFLPHLDATTVYCLPMPLIGVQRTRGTLSA